MPKSSPLYVIATWGYLGLLPISGTWGSLGALPFAFVIKEHLGWPILLIATLVLLAIGIFVSNWYEEQSGAHDSSEIVVDEVVGQWIACLFLPITGPDVWLWWLGAFVAFRFFDITKIWPANVIDHKMPKGYGVMLDDVVAGIYALGAIELARYFL